MKLIFLVVFTGLAMSVRADEPTNATPATEVSGPKVETIVCIRHGEKPKGGLGQLSCRGLNRALALPNVLLGKFGTPQYVFAPNPTEKSDMLRYYYVRPLMTIEPTAIRCGLPVNTEFGFTKIEGLEHEVLGRKYENAVVFVAWEHYLLDHFVKDVLKANGGDPKQVPSWPESDYDTIFVIKITQSAAGKSVTFTVDHEGLNNLSDACP
jgi:hypothetical protein